MRTTLGFIPLAFAAVVGCSSSTSTAPVLAAPVQAGTAGDASVAANAVAFGALATDPLVLAPSAADEAATAASNAAQAAATNYTPSGCAVAIANGSTVSYTLHNCTGPLGARGMDGSLSVAFTSQSDGLHLAITSPALAVGEDTISLNRQGIFVSNGTARTFQVTDDTSTSNGPVGSVAHQSAHGSLTWTAGSTCATYNATENVSFGSLALVVTDVDIVRCNGQPCSQSGSAKVADSGGGSITVTFNATPTARFKESNLNTGSLFLACGNVM